MGQSLLLRLNEITNIRKANTSYLSDRFSNMDGCADNAFELPQAVLGSEPAYLRFPIVVRDTHVKKEILDGLRAKGINASDMYTGASYVALRNFASRPSDCPRAEYLADRMIDLPTHPYMRARDLDDAVNVFSHHPAIRHSIDTAVAV